MKPLKKYNLKQLYTIWFQIYEILEKAETAKLSLAARAEM